MIVPIIDIFAGPGGLGEGFSALINPQTNQRLFKIVLSIEKDFYAPIKEFFSSIPSRTGSG